MVYKSLEQNWEIPIRLLLFDILNQVIPSHPLHYNSKDENIFRIASEDDIVVVAITFLLYSFINITPYTKFTSEKYKKTDFFDENLKINYEDILLFNQEHPQTKRTVNHHIKKLIILYLNNLLKVYNI